MEKFFNIEGLENSYGMVSGEDIDGKYYLKLGDYASHSQVEITKEAFHELHKQFGIKVNKTYSYTVDIFKGLGALGQQLEFFKTVAFKSYKQLSDDEVRKQAYEIVGRYPKSHTIKIYRLED